MSESEKKNWRIELKEIVQDTLKAWKAEQTPTPAPSAKDEHPTHSLEELISCPDCYPKIKKAVLDKEVLSRKDKEYECDDCGTRVDEEEDECPTCGGKDATRR